VRAYIAVTDRDWYGFLRDRPDLDEVNFWQPGGSRQFKYLKLGCTPSLIKQGRGSSIRPFHAPAFFSGVERRALLVG
jgi:hypothetical protein